MDRFLQKLNRYLAIPSVALRISGQRSLGDALTTAFVSSATVLYFFGA